MRGLALGLILLLAACDPGDVVLLAPETTSGGPTLSIHAVIDTPYAALAASLGWNGGVPGAEVRVHLMSEPYDSSYWHQARADSSGVASFPGLGGLYEVEVTRTLTSAETTSAGGAIHVLAGGRRLYAPTSGAAEVTMAPDQRGALVFSEFMLSTPPETETAGTTYPDGTYAEVYNNSDTTVYLDGKYLGVAWLWNRDLSYMPCSQTEPVRNDPDGIWAEYIFRFPGSGTDYPLAPGHTAVIARSAIDHRGILPTLPDLSHADFEYGGRADNPDVPDLEDIGLRLMPGGPVITLPAFLSEPVDLTSLPRYTEPYSGQVFVRIPRALILDAHSGVEDFTTTGYQALPNCLEDLHRSFDRLPGPATAFPTDYNKALSLQRRVLMVLPAGRKLLQDTNTSMFDFVKAPRTPGWIPDP
jgi:hypothetical protein